MNKMKKPDSPETPNVQRCYKDTLFRTLFKDRKNLLSLYNALNGTDYTNVDDLEITTLENAVYMNYKNDISFVFDLELMLYEHQSTVNPNMPLRDLVYVTSVLQKRVDAAKLYGSRQVMIPAPRFVVFYNGTKAQPEKRLLRLSDAYEKPQEHPELELTVTVYNINKGCNQKIMAACRMLQEYAEYVARVREYAASMPLAAAVESAVDECIREGILSDFLKANRAEAINVWLYEFNEEEYRQCLYEEGLEDGIKRGVEQGIEQSFDLLQTLTAAGRTEDVERAIADPEYRKTLYTQYLSRDPS